MTYLFALSLNVGTHESFLKIRSEGLPHYGHILAGTIKDVVTRYFTAKGHHVTRRFGWDCHGLPVEYEIDQKLNIKTREDVLFET